MPMRHGQRQHIIHSLEALLYQLHALSFFISPSIWIFICRIASQFQFTRPRDQSPDRSLRFWFFLILLFNLGGVWTHATESTTQRRSIVLDFVGMAHPPSKIRVLVLDFSIILLQMVLTTIAYETSLSKSTPDTPDPLLPIPPTPTLDMLSGESHYDDKSESPYVIDLTLAHVFNRLRNPPPPAAIGTRAGLLPLPNTTSWQPAALRSLMRLRPETRERTRAVRTGQPREGATDVPGSVPGAMDSDDGE